MFGCLVSGIGRGRGSVARRGGWSAARAELPDGPAAWRTRHPFLKLLRPAMGMTHLRSRVSQWEGKPAQTGEDGRCGRQREAFVGDEPLHRRSCWRNTLNGTEPGIDEGRFSPCPSPPLRATQRIASGGLGLVEAVGLWPRCRVARTINGRLRSRSSGAKRASWP